MSDMSWLGVALILSAVCFALFKCGQWIGEGVVLVKRIEGEQMKEFEKKFTFGPAVIYDLKRKAVIRIVGPFVVLCILYIVIAVQFNVIASLIALPSLFIVWLGSKRIARG